MKARTLLLPSLVLVAGAHATRADAIDDFAAGATVRVESATVDPGGGPRSSTGSGAIGKRAGSLDLVLEAADLGAKLPLALHLRGTRLRDGLIRYDVDDRFEPPIDVGDGHVLVAVRGQLTMRAQPLAGRHRPTVGNVRVVLAGDSRLVARTDLGELPIVVDALAIQGGLRQPPLAGFRDPSDALICSDRRATDHTLEVKLADAATATTAVVDLTTERGSGVHVPGGVIVPRGHATARVPVRIDPDVVGRVRLTAAAGGEVQELVLDVHPADDCARR